MIITCSLGAESAFFRPDPFPGSAAARAKGCHCPEEQPWPGGLKFASDCPVHQLEEGNLSSLANSMGKPNG
jgi:hypothetical protein